jgi:hypothetical protein
MLGPAGRERWWAPWLLEFPWRIHCAGRRAVRQDAAPPDLGGNSARAGLPPGRGWGGGGRGAQRRRRGLRLRTLLRAFTGQSIVRHVCLRKRLQRLLQDELQQLQQQLLQELQQQLQQQLQQLLQQQL